jgi:hypothetical protein
MIRDLLLAVIEFPPLPYCARCAQHHAGPPCPPAKR